MNRSLPIVYLAFFCSLLPATNVVAQSYYFTGSIKDSVARPIPFVQIKLKGSPIVFQAGSSGEFGIPSFNRTDSAICYVAGFDTIHVFFSHGKFEKIVLPYTTDMLERARMESRLSSLVKKLNSSAEKTTSNSGSGESYNEIVENQFVEASHFPATGFVPNNNHASYSNVRRFIHQDSRIPPNAVRIEEMWNYFSPQLDDIHTNKDGFGTAAQLAMCPWQPDHWLLMLNAVAPKIAVENLPPANMVFLIDNSGSMEDNNRLPLLKIGFKKLVEHLRPIDKVAIVTYGGAPGIMLPPTAGNEKDKINTAIDELIAGGATQGSNGIQLAYQLATTNPIVDGVNKVILATDGDFNVGVIENDALERMISAYRGTGVTLTCLGVGMGNYKDSKIEVLAKMGNGNFAYLDSEEEAQKVMVEELTENLYNVAWESTIQIDFDAKWVKAYKLIGYDNRQQALSMGKQVLMGSNIGSGQGIVAMFEIIPETNFPVQTINLGNWQFHYKKSPDDSLFTDYNYPLHTAPQSLPETDSAFKQATALAWYGMQLRNASIDQPVSFEQPLALAKLSFSAGNKTGAGFIALLQKTHLLYHPEKEPRKKRKLFKKQ